MAVQVVSVGNANGSDVQFRLWGSTISNAIVAAGLPRTADTGQVNWTTVTRPAAGANVYEVFRFNDALQATHPVFIRIGWGSASNQLNPQIWISVGTATDGAGNLTAHVSYPNSFGPAAPGRTVMYNSSTNYTTTTPGNVYVDSDGGSSLMVAGWFALPTSSPTTSGVSFLIERTRDWDGTPNGEGVTMFSGSGDQVGLSCQTIVIANAPWLATQPSTFTPYVFPPLGTPAVGWLNNTQYLFPYFSGMTPQLHAPSKHVVGVVAADMPPMTQMDLTYYGVTKRWITSNSAWGFRPVFRIQS